jgi:DNA-binding transcriptional LysR family regulator
MARRIVTTDVGLYATKACLDRWGRPHRPDQLAKHNLLMPLYPGGLGELTLISTESDERSQAVAVTRPAPLRTPHTDTLYSAALGGLGISAIPSMIADDSLMNHALERVLPAWYLWRLTLFAAVPTRKHMPTRIRAFMEFLAKRFGSEAEGALPVFGRAGKR